MHLRWGQNLGLPACTQREEEGQPKAEPWHGSWDYSPAQRRGGAPLLAAPPPLCNLFATINNKRRSLLERVRAHRAGGQWPAPAQRPPHGPGQSERQVHRSAARPPSPGWKGGLKGRSLAWQAATSGRRRWALKLPRQSASARLQASRGADLPFQGVSPWQTSRGCSVLRPRLQFHAHFPE